jgi:prevent-host-death family protein
MDSFITATDANQHFSEILRKVSQGESYTVTSRGKAVARMVPVENANRSKSLKELFHEMSSLPGLVTGPWKREDLYER